MNTLPRSLAFLATLAAFVGLAYWSGGNARERSVREQLAGQLVQVRTDTVHVRDTIYRRDTIRLRTTLRQWDSVRVTDTLTLVRNDTTIVYVPRAAADTAVAVCLQVVRSCESRVAARDSLISALRDQVRAVSQRPSLIERWASRIGWLGAGYLAGSLSRR